MRYKLRDWMKTIEYRGQKLEEKLKQESMALSANYNAIDYIKANDIKIAYDYLSKNTNPNALPLLAERIHMEMYMTKKELNDEENRINWKLLWANINIFGLIELLKKDISKNLSENPNYYSDPESEKALKLLNIKLNNPNYSELSANSSDKALDILLKNIHRIDYDKLSGNTNPRAIELLKAKLIINQDDPDIDWVNLSGNSAPEAIELLKVYKSKINMRGLSSNSSDWALTILEAEAKLDEKARAEAIPNTRYRSKIHYGDLSGNTNPRAIEILKRFPYSISWIEFCANPSIFTINNRTPSIFTIDNRNASMLKIIKKTDAYLLAKDANDAKGAKGVKGAKYSFGVSTTSSLRKMSENAEKMALALDFKRMKKRSIFERLKQFFNDLSKEIHREDSILIKNITSNIKPNDTKEFNDYTLHELVTTFIYNIYNQLSNPELQPSVEKLYLSHINKLLRHKDSRRLLEYIERGLSNFIDNYKPRLDIKLKEYIKNIIEDTIPIYVTQKLDDKDDERMVHSGIESHPYYNFYYIMINDSAKIPDENGRVPDEELRLPIRKGLLIRNIMIQQMDNGVRYVLVDKNAQNGFTYEECKMWVLMPIFNPRTFKPIKIDSPLYNRLLCMSYQYNTNLIPRMLTSDGHKVLLSLRNSLRELKKDPPQTRQQLEKYIRDEEKKANGEEDYTFKECLQWVRHPNKDPKTENIIRTDGKEYNMIFKQAILFDPKIQPMNITLTGNYFKNSVLKILGIVESESSNSEDIEGDAYKEACKAFNNIYEGEDDYREFKSRMVKVCQRHNKNNVICMDTFQASIVSEFPTDVPTDHRNRAKFKYYEISALASIFIFYRFYKWNGKERERLVDKLNIDDDEFEDIFTNNFKIFNISGIYEIITVNDKLEFKKKATVDAGGPIREFFTNLFEELFCDDKNHKRPFIRPKDNIADRYYINPNFAPDENFKKVISVYAASLKKSDASMDLSYDHEDIYTLIGKILCLVFVNKEIKLPKQLSKYIITGLMKQPEYITIYDLLYFYVIEFNNAHVRMNMITDTQINFIDDIGEDFNEYYVISKTDHIVKKDTCIKFLLQLAKHIVTKNFLQKVESDKSSRKKDPSEKSMKSLYTSLFNGFNNKLRTFIRNKVSVEQLNSMITNKKMDEAILQEFASKIKITMEGTNTLTESQKQTKVEEMRIYITNIITNNANRNTDEEHYVFIRSLLRFWTALPNYDKDTNYTIYYKYGNYIVYQYNEGNEIQPEIHPYNVNNLPVAATCFNQLDLFGYPQTIPEKDREQYIYDKLKLAIFNTPSMENQ